MKILVYKTTETREYAAFELKKYIQEMSRGSINPEIEFSSALPSSFENVIVLAGLSELSLDTSDLYDKVIEDIIDVDIKNLSGYIAGSNDRSILMGVYRYCTYAGCRFLRPGEDGEYIPFADLLNISYTYRKKADCPFRGECTEGAVSYEHIRDTIYWLPKVGMNLYMIEGLVPYAYMNRWYAHKGNNFYKNPEGDASYEKMEEYTLLIEKDIRKTGLQYHSLGHAWMFEPFGIHTGDPKGEETIKNCLTPEQKKHLALVNGKRDLCHGHSFFTHFCYSNPETRDILTTYLANYIKEKPWVDFVHFWLADSVNNQCECEQCQKLIPTDWYVMMMNELDEKLTKIGSDAKVVFILYNETMRPPRTQKINNPKRCILLGCGPLHAEYPYKNVDFDGEEIPFVRNKYQKASEELKDKWRKDWLKLSSGEMQSFVFEYRFYRDMYCDLSGMQISREAHRDMISLKDVGYKGSISDQTHRMAMPTALPRIAFGETMFDNSVDFEKLCKNYFEGAFGVDGIKVYDYLEKLSVLLCPSNFRVGGRGGLMEAALGDALSDDRKCWLNNPYVAEQSQKIPALVNEFKNVIYENIGKADNIAQMKSWDYLRYHGEICILVSKLLYKGATLGMDGAREEFENIREYLTKNEMEFHKVFDSFLYLRGLCHKLETENPEFG